MLLLTKDKVRIERAQHVYLKEDGVQPPSGTQIFCGNLPRNMLEIELFPYFSLIGEIYEFRLMMEFSGFSRGFCFVTYMKVEHADQAVRSLHGYVLKDRELCVYKSWDNTKLFIFGIPYSTSPEQIRTDLKGIFAGIVNVICKPDQETGKGHRGWAFLEFDNHRNASACRKMIWPNKLIAWGSTLRAEWARPERAPDVRNDCSLILQNLPVSMSKAEVYDLVQLKLKSSILQIYKKIGSTIATIEFNSPQGANLSKKILRGLQYDGQPIIVKKRQELYSSPATPTSTSSSEISSDDDIGNKRKPSAAPNNVAKISGNPSTSRLVHNAFPQVFADPEDYLVDCGLTIEQQLNYYRNLKLNGDANLFCFPLETESNYDGDFSMDVAYHQLFSDDPEYRPSTDANFNMEKSLQIAYEEVVSAVVKDLQVSEVCPTMKSNEM